MLKKLFLFYETGDLKNIQGVSHSLYKLQIPPFTSRPWAMLPRGYTKIFCPIRHVNEPLFNKDRPKAKSTLEYN
jgi:hypothetical protein